MTGRSIKSRSEHIYGRKFGMALTLEAFQPAQSATGGAVMLILSEGWYSDPKMIDPILETIVSPLLLCGHTVFAVTHSSNPKFTMIDAIEDVHLAVRYIKHHANSFDINPERIGAVGWSAGGQLALSLACQPQAGLKTDDPVMLQSSDVSAVTVYFAAIDFLDWDGNGTAMIGNHSSVPLYGAFAFDKFNDAKQCFDPISNDDERLAIAKRLSPIEWANANQAACCLVVGDADIVVPPIQSDRLAEKMAEVGGNFDKVVIKGGTHDMDTVANDITTVISWFEKHL